MDTDGELNLRFAVELPEKSSGSNTSRRVKTGDESGLILYATVALAAGLLFIVLAFISRRRDRRDTADGEGSGRR